MQVRTWLSRLAILGLFVTTLSLTEEALSREFLDYLVDFETEDGEWLDPEELEMMALLQGGSSSTEEQEVTDDES